MVVAAAVPLAVTVIVWDTGAGCHIRHSLEAARQQRRIAQQLTMITVLRWAPYLQVRGWLVDVQDGYEGAYPPSPLLPVLACVGFVDASAAAKCRPVGGFGGECLV
jgi:hypothetical protein